MKRTTVIISCLGIAIICMSVYAITKYYTILGNRKIGPQPDGSILVASNQLLRPAGFQVELPGRPRDLALTPDEKWLVVKNMEDLDLVNMSNRKIMQTLPYPRGGSSFTGLCLSRDGHRIYTANAADHINVALLDSDNILHWTAPIVLPKPSIGGQPVPGGLAFNEAGDKLLVTLSRNNTLAVIDMQETSGIIEIPVGMVPYDVLTGPGHKAYVTDWGGRRPRKGETTYNSSGSRILVDPRTGSAMDGCVSVVSLDSGKEVKYIEVGRHPCGMTLSPDRLTLYVTCANSDSIYVIDTRTDEVTDKISVHARKDIPFGSAPNDLTVSPDGKYLYVANGTENAICVIPTENPSKIAGYIPTGWYPGSVILNRSGKILCVANIKGIGSRNKGTERKGFNSHDHLGTVSIIPVPDEKALAGWTNIVHENNFYVQMLQNLHPADGQGEKLPVPRLPNQTSVFKHVIYIIKENRTYDQVLGDMTQGDGDTSLVQFGRAITPNHHHLAESFVLMDNFNCNGILSADGHQWADEAYVTDYIERAFDNWPRSYPYDGNDAMAYAPGGFIWDNVLKHGLTFRDYGEFVQTVPTKIPFLDIYNDVRNGTNKIEIHGKATVEQLSPYICPSFPGFGNNVPDAYRASEFLKEFKGFEKKGNLPNFIIMELPNDHTSGTTPGRPTPLAAAADNDLALGQIVDAVSHSKFWKETCIFVTEDDPQAGLDHVDGHRTVGLVISPYTKRKKVVSTYYSQINMVRTMENILGLPPMNQLDLTADPMSDCFTSQPDFTPYNVLPNNIPLDQMNLSLNKLKGDALYWARMSLKQDLDDADRIEEDVFNKIIWHSIKGYNRPYPVIRKEE